MLLNDTVNCSIGLVSPRGKSRHVILLVRDSKVSSGDGVHFTGGDKANHLALDLAGDGTPQGFTIKGTRVGKSNLSVWLGRVDGDRYTIQGGNGDMKPVEVKMPTVSIGINETSVTNDDLVRVGDMTHCLIRLSNPLKGGGDVRVRLLCPDSSDPSGDRYSFNGGSSANQLDVTLPADGSPRPFSISGRFIKETDKLNNTKIVVWLIQPAKVGPSLLEKPLTVFDLRDANVNVAPMGNWALYAPGSLTPSNSNFEFTAYYSGTGVKMQARITVKPGLLDSNAPQLRDLRTGILQTLLASTSRVIYKNPRVTSWNRPATSSGTPPYKLVLSAERSLTTQLPVTRRGYNDTDMGAAPLYNQSTTSLTYLYGTLQGKTAITDDSPTMRAAIFIQTPVYRNGVLIAQVRYDSLSRITDSARFRTYGVLWNNDTQTYKPLRETTWLMDVNSASTNQKAQADAKDAAYHTLQAPDAPIANVVYGAPANTTSQSFGTATVTFSR